MAESKKLQGDYSLSDVVLCPLRNGEIYQWIYFGETGAKFRLIQTARRNTAKIYDFSPPLVDSYLGNISQLCQDKVVDIDGEFVPRKARLVLSPDFILSRVKKKESLETVIKEAPIVTLEPGKWRNRVGVLSWEIRLNAESKGWNSHSASPTGLLIMETSTNEEPPPEYRP